MNIHEDGTAEIDLDELAADLESARLIHNDSVRRGTVARVQAAALLDIAMSLRILAAEAGAAMGVDISGEFDYAPAEPDYGELDDAPRDFLIVGDLVTVKGDTEPGEVIAVGSDGEPWADVDFAVTKGMRYYARNLERLVGDAGEGVDPEAVAAIRGKWAAASEAFEPQNPEAGLGLVGSVGVDDVVEALRDDESEDAYEPDIDEDFEPDPVAELAANEAKRKAAKKGKKK